MKQDLEDKKNKIIIEGLEGKIKEHEAALEKKDFMLQTMEGSLAEAQAEIVRLNRELSTKSKSFEQGRKILMRSLKLKLQKVWTCKSHWGNFKINVWTSATVACSDWRKSSTQLEPVLKSLNLQLKTCQASLIILKSRLMLLMKS
jgi:energy-converting hydrogenase Eha subunit E